MLASVCWEPCTLFSGQKDSCAFSVVHFLRVLHDYQKLSIELKSVRSLCPDVSALLSRSAASRINPFCELWPKTQCAISMPAQKQGSLHSLDLLGGPIESDCCALS